MDTSTEIMTQYLYLKGDAFIKSSPIFWEYGNWYNPLIAACSILFGDNSVRFDTKSWTIKIRSRISLTINCSGNEGKVYIRTTQEPRNHDLPMNQQDYSLRFFSYRETINFLLKMKEVENYIIEYEG